MNFIEKVGFRRGLSLLLHNINKTMFKSGPLVLACIFCVSGVLQPTIVEFLTLSGAFEKSTLLIVLPNYIGMSFAVLTRFEVVYTTLQFVIWWDMLLLAMVDIVSQGMCLIGLVYAGSSIYIIVYSSTTIWAAVWSYFLLQKELIFQQWLGIVIVVFGLSITAYDGKTSSTVSAKSTDTMIGILLIVLGSFTHALTWVLIEKWTKQRNEGHGSDSSGSCDSDIGVGGHAASAPRPAPAALSSAAAQTQAQAAPELECSLMGLFGCLFYSAWQLVYTLPRWEELVLRPIAERQGNLWHIAVAYSLLALMGFLHAVSFYHLLGHLGSVATGVMKGVQSVAVLVLSHAAFCGVESSQCFTAYKGVSLVVVLCGVFYYTANTMKKKQQGGDCIHANASRRHVYEPISDDGGSVIEHALEIL
jgi:drug/metabolite transporter (DMT)-like permease